jgi:hypothetical protein
LIRNGGSKILKYELVEKLLNRQGEDGENSYREWVFLKDTHLKAGGRRDEE